MLNLTKYIDYRIFLYGSIAHSSLFITYFLFNSKMLKIKSIRDIIKLPLFVTALYFVAHVFISSAMVDRINVNNIGNLLSTVLGVIGHSLLFIYGISNPQVNNAKYGYWDFIFIIGQIGMILIYINLHKYKNKYVKYHPYFAFTLIYFLLFIYYMHSVSKHLKKSLPLSGGLFLVGMLYFTFAANEIYKYLKTDSYVREMNYVEKKIKEMKRKLKI